MLTHERPGRRFGVLWARDLAEKGVPCVGSTDTALLLFAIECKCIRAKLFAPKCFFEIRLQVLRRSVEFTSEFGFVQSASKQCAGKLCRVCVALHFTQSDRWLGQTPVLVEHGILRIFPALLHQAF